MKKVDKKILKLNNNNNSLDDTAIKYILQFIYDLGYTDAVNQKPRKEIAVDETESFNDKRD